jgi:hypothetical protein
MYYGLSPEAIRAIERTNRILREATRPLAVAAAACSIAAIEVPALAQLLPINVPNFPALGPFKFGPPILTNAKETTNV